MEDFFELLLEKLLGLVFSPVGLALLLVWLLGRNNKKQQPTQAEEYQEADQRTDLEQEETNQPEPEEAALEEVTGQAEGENEPSVAEQLGFEIPELRGAPPVNNTGEVYIETEGDDFSRGDYVDEQRAEAGFDDEWEMEKRPRGQQYNRGAELERQEAERHQAVHHTHHHSKLEEKMEGPAMVQRQLPIGIENRQALIGAVLSSEILGRPKARQRYKIK